MLHRSFSPILLVTERLIIRTYLETDAQSLHAFVHENRDLLYDTGPFTLRNNGSIGDSRSFILERNRERQEGRWVWNGVYRKEDLQFLGQVVITRLPGWPRRGEIGYFITQSEHGKGYATEAVEAVVNHCFGPLQMHGLFLRIKPDNHASLRVAQKLGFARRKLASKDFQNFHGHWLDSVYWWQKAPGSWISWLIAH